MPRWANPGWGLTPPIVLNATTDGDGAVALVVMVIGDGAGDVGWLLLPPTELLNIDGTKLARALMMS